jgi:hypothetical protein
LADEFFERVGEIAVGFAWLEDMVSELLHALCGTEKAAVFTKSMAFGVKCQKINSLMNLDPDHPIGAEIRKWVTDCQELGKLRNTVLHSRHQYGGSGQWNRIVTEGKETMVPTSELLAINDRIFDLWERGNVYLQWRAIDDEDRDDPRAD